MVTQLSITILKSVAKEVNYIDKDKSIVVKLFSFINNDNLTILENITGINKFEKFIRIKVNKEESVKNMEVNKGKYSVYKEKYDSVNFVGRARSFRSANNATSIVRMRIFE